jgi:hypothetical protein
MTFHIKRYLKDGHIYKEIDFEDKGQNFIYRKVNPDPKDLKLMEDWNLSIGHFGDYKLKKFHKTDSERLIMIF